MDCFPSATQSDTASVHIPDEVIATLGLLTPLIPDQCLQLIQFVNPSSYDFISSTMFKILNDSEPEKPISETRNKNLLMLDHILQGCVLNMKLDALKLNLTKEIVQVNQFKLF
ncbi:hypothetical protein NPIL_11081 [Nephila pilipes]|uniref:Uncharacterized protein n=1 Tax=Nephila pilipes TaxID=299642 RepID=A0A8X6T073_NEPPI|nr:hypothetical protein NPIL_11081 [Nephila pilipes]